MSGPAHAWCRRGAVREHTATRAVTLYEMLVVLAVAGILTVFFCYSAQYLIVTTRVSRVKEEHRVLSRALQNYEADYAGYPNTRTGLHALYAPVAYMVRIPTDPFSASREIEYAYIGAPSAGIRGLIISQGPDRKSDLLQGLGLARSAAGAIIGRPDDRSDTFSLRGQPIESLLTLYTYDPTNGIVSGGDIITAIEGKPVTSRNDLLLALEQYQPGAKVTLTVYRNGRTLQVDVTLGQQ